MNKAIFLILICSFFINVSAQQEGNYMMVMVQHKKSLNMARNVTDFQSLANNFERIANSETNQWHPLYYAALCYINMSIVTDKLKDCDGYLDKAQTLIKKALVIYPDESELFVLQALLYQGRIKPDPADRGLNYLKKASEELNKAKSYNPDNPRIFYLMGMNLVNLTETAGGGATAACPMFETATQKFRTDTPSHVLSPTWGAEHNEQLYNQYCKSQ